MAGTAFAVVAFTNLQRDHLDFHQDMEHYFAAKAQLFTPAYARRGVVMVDDEWGRRLAQTAAIPIETVSATPASEGYEHATWRVTEQRVDQETLATSFTLAGPGGVTVSATVQLPGSVNVANAALAIVTAHAAGVSWHDSAAGVAGVAGVPGRMERIDDPVSSGPRVIVDFAHTPDAIELIAGTTRTLAHGRLVVVVGATGQRDAGKRPLMGAAAAHWADEVVVTDDDPHGEDPGPIREQVAQGARQAAAEQGRAVAVRIVAPRAVAIRTAIRDAADADTVLILGRGHEVIQEIDGVDYALDDRVEAREALNLRADGDGGSL